MNQPQRQVGRPLCLPAYCTLAPNTNSGVNSTALMNPTGGAMELLAVKFHLEDATVPGTIVGGGTIAVSLMAGDVPCTKDFVPVWLFGKAKNLGTPDLGTNPTPFANLGSFQTGEGDYLWELSTPFYIPPGMTLEPVFQHKGQISDSIKVTVVYFCRSVDGDPPSKVTFPFVASFETGPMSTNDGTELTENQVFITDETDLANQFSQALRIKRLSGRIAAFSYFGVDGPGLTALDTSYEWIGTDVLELIAYDSSGFETVKDPTKWRSVFTGAHRTWEMDTMLPANAYLMVQVTENIGVPGGGQIGNRVIVDSSVAYVNFTAQIAIVAEREVFV